MKAFTVCKDGGPLSHVWAYILVELKWLFSVMLLRFEDGSREAYHDHAFNALSWLLKGELVEYTVLKGITVYRPSFLPIWTPRDRFHKVSSNGTSWAITFRGPWVNIWHEWTFRGGYIDLTHGRKEVAH